MMMTISLLYVFTCGWLLMCCLGLSLGAIAIWQFARFIAEMDDYDTTFWLDKWIDNEFTS